MVLRDFLYLDRTLVRDFLAQAEGGLFDEATERERTSGKGGIGGRIGTAGAGINAEKAKEASFETEAKVHQVAASEFDRLYAYIEKDGLQIVELATEASDIAGVRRKQFLEVDGRVSLGGVQQVLELISTLTGLLPVMEGFGATVDEKAVADMQTIGALDVPDKPVAVIAAVAGAAGFRVALDLKRDCVMVDAWDVEASVLFKVQRVIRGEERYLVGDPFGGLLKHITGDERAEFLASLQSEELAQFGIGDAEIGAPAVVGTPIAIYR